LANLLATALLWGAKIGGIMEVIKGGFSYNATDERTIHQQRAITAQINNNFIQVGAVFLQMAGKMPFNSDWYKRKFRDTNLQEWIDNPTYRDLNLGFNLQFGWLDVDIDAEDVRYNHAIISAFKFLGIDTRFAFGRLSKNVASHLLVQLSDADIANYDMMKEFEPGEFKLDSKRFKSELRSMGPVSTDSPNTVKEARQTVMPGSVYLAKNDASKYDISVWYTSSGIATSVGEVAATTPHRTTFAQLVTGIAFGTFLYIMQPHWMEGSRQSFATTLSGWLARLVIESKGINENEGVQRGTFCPVSSPEVAESMLDFLCEALGDREVYMRKRVFRDALKKLENNPDAKIRGWKTLGDEIGAEPLQALRIVFMPGIDVTPLTKMAEVYVYDDSDDQYVDRERFLSQLNFTHDPATLMRRHSNDFMEVAGKMKPLFKIFEASPLRRRVSGRELYPDFQPGSIFRLSRSGDIVPDDQDAEPGTVTMFNTWRGWPILPTENPDEVLIHKCNLMMDKLFGYLTQDNKTQMEWIKKWISWIVQFPGQKQQVAPVFIGGQGVGKSFFGNTFLGQLFQNQWGSASPKVLEGGFSVEPFINKMIVFIDEAKFHNEASVDEIKKIIRNVELGGQEKYLSSKTHRLFSRVVFASNRFDIGINQRNVRDRALFYMKTYDKEFLHMSDLGFEKWAVTLKPFFKEFSDFIRRKDVKEHFMYIFNTTPVEQAALEDVSISAGDDTHIVESNMSHPRRAAKAIVEEGRIWEDLDISATFTIPEFNKRVEDISKSMQLRYAQPRVVFDEFQSAGLLEPHIENNSRMWRFKYKIGTLTEMFGLSIGVELSPRFVFTDEDFGVNDSKLLGSKLWKGSNSSRLKI
jgi:hypothetical protein